ncbi:beta-lactamase [Pseudarthrobacter chlorophenolicus A6]|uniref:Beta-lactamase n=1 Tax=Pseudarthrobacter chlorophenolicus (strain ATCC 700700 / DSM 12829 / CIP 107037 / JCM 12360 / KCTC 9906 / NCIMB 13794 / A6) TaxID=452863 RepID=B8HGJ5_PSECP|nr:serine hydrolase [Pseudarthrobacter chlorophenolicus]ACL41261.1 beta-lactamase [Pseudarthrobacter chlorophenolicus A6]SDQ67410.1 beta-lactamase class A [Pseudarthrobacter chlorophenolicus]
MTVPGYDAGAGASALRQAAQVLESAGLSGSLLVRHLGTGQELALDADRLFPLASVAKLPLAAAALDAAHRGRFELSMPVRIDDSSRSQGGPGIARFAHPATIAAGDLIRLAVELSDNSAADAIFRIVSPEEVTEWLRALGTGGIILRHPIGELYASLATQAADHDAAAVHSLVVQADQQGHPSPLPQLDVERANAGTARGLADLLQKIWDGTVSPAVAAPLREMLAANVFRHRLAPDFSADTSTWYSKTGSFVHLRHEAGVVEHTGGPALAVVALTRSRVPAVIQPSAEQAMGHAARILHDELV